MPEWLSGLLNLTREISSKIALPIFFAASIILFIPDRYAVRIGIDNLRVEYAFYFGLLLIISATALICNFLWSVFDLYKGYLKQELFVFHQKRNIKSFTNDEKIILRKFIKEGETEIHGSPASGVLAMLENRNIIIRASNIGIGPHGFSYIMQPWARDYLSRKPKLLE